MSAIAELVAEIEADPGLAEIRRRVEETLDGDPAHDLGHLLRVAHWTLGIGGDEIDRREAIAAALIHDFVNVPKTSPDRASASELSAAAARELLPAAGFDPPAVDRIADAVRDHSFSRGAVPETPLGRALQDADRLETQGALGLIRVFATGARMAAAPYHPTDPWAQNRPLDDHAYTVDHFFTKLLGLPETLLTQEGRAEAKRRVRVLEEFLDTLADEIGEPRHKQPL